MEVSVQVHLNLILEFERAEDRVERVALPLIEICRVNNQSEADARTSHHTSAKFKM